ncbi:MAG: recombinase family protein [Lachnospiraceae bacterium]
MDKGVLYLRLSKEDADKLHDGDNSESINNQRLLLADYALQKEIQIVDVYSDDDYSGLYDDRPEFDRLIQDSKLGKFNVVIAKSQSRFTRNMAHMEKYLHHDFPLLGIRFIGVVDGTDTSIQGNKKARQIYGLTNEWYCEDLSANIRSVLKQKMRNGQFIGSFAPYGYLKSKEDRHQLIIDAKAAENVRQIFKLYLQGYSVKQICHILEDEEISNPTVYKKEMGLAYENNKSKEFGQKYNLWSTTTVSRILGNETYIGTLIQGTCEKSSYKDKKIVTVPKEQWIVVRHHHEPIVDLDIFMNVQKLRSKRRVIISDQNKKTSALAGKIRCSDCGSTMIKSGGVRGKKGDWYLRCQLANKTRLQACTSHNILYSTVEKTVLEEIQSLVLPIFEKEQEKKDIYNYIKKFNNLMKEKEIKQKQVIKLHDKLVNQKNIMFLLYNDRVKGLVSDETFLHLQDEFEEITIKIKNQIQNINIDIEMIEMNEQSKQSMEGLLSQYCDYSKLTHEMVIDFIDYIEVFEREKEVGRQKLTIHWNL